MLHSAYSVKLGDTVLAGVTRLDSQTNPEVEAEVGIGSQFPQFAVVRALKPRIAFQSRAIAAALTALGTTGAAITALNKLLANYVELENGAPSSSGIGYTLDKGLIFPRQLTVSHRKDAVLDIDSRSISADGSTAPMTFGAATIGTLTRDNLRHTLKSVTVAGVTFDCNTDVTIDFGINADTLGCNSNIYDSHVTQEGGVTPTITVTTQDVAKLSQLTLDGKRGDVVIVLRQYDPSGIGFEADDTNDITLTGKGISNFTNLTGDGNGIATGPIKTVCDWDGTNAPLTIS
ncbi:hypothetical protein [Allorhodopirellula heiligendammensis]|uniref:Uncharacterized protein n=1 Tax=Allorhodopirellula heiligendammensis TaxID=2714739 RepID=A0A5C6BV70_9BACT|nr:hypothetical protein [Allorhodopirellula heiligendammensis]TWU15958.1 hypothetical protein Poly21_31620 [Allorhodopirellula heiligendammensis]